MSNDFEFSKSKWGNNYFAEIRKNSGELIKWNQDTGPSKKNGIIKKKCNTQIGRC